MSKTTPLPPKNFVGHRDFQRIARAIAFVDKEFRQQPKVAAIARHVGLSEYHFSRLFHRWAGISPKQYLQVVTARQARAALQEEPSLLDAAAALGLSGTSRLHDLMVSIEAATPAEVRAKGAGITLQFGFSDSPFGRMLVAASRRGVAFLSFLDGDDGKAERAAVEDLRQHWSAAQLQRDDAVALRYARQIFTPLAANNTRTAKSAAPSLNVIGTPFQLRVWKALLQLGSRPSVTYRDVAQQIGMPRAARAVGNAVGANPVGFLIPCHHVLRGGGALGGYRWGVERKRTMLAWEGVLRVAATN